MSSTVGLDVEGILDPLETIERRGFGRYDVFRDWIDLMLSALQRDDDTYLDTLDRYDRDGDRDRGERVPDCLRPPSPNSWPRWMRRTVTYSESPTRSSGCRPTVRPALHSSQRRGYDG